MGDGLINFANIGWLLTLGAIYYITSNWESIPKEHLDKAKALYSKVKDYPLPLIAMGFWLWLRVLFALGWQLQLELLMVLSMCNYGYRLIMRARGRAAQDIRRELTASSNPAAVLGSRLPEWVTTPSANRVQWLNTTITSLWPSIVGATETTIRSVLEPLLESNKPSFVYGFRLKSASIGPNPMVLNGIQHHVYGITETTLDIAVTWDADMDIRLLVRVPGPDVEVSITDFEMRLMLRVVLGPHIPQWPCFANMAVSIVGTPEIDFNVKAAKISLDAVPGLGSFLDGFIRHTLVGMLAYPKSFVIPIVRGYEARSRASRALGTLKLHFLRIDNLLSKYNKYKKTPFYCKLEMAGSSDKRLRTASYTGFTTAMKDTFTFTLYDNTGVINVSLALDVVGSDLHLGECDIQTKVLIDTDLEETELIMTKSSDASHTRRASVFVRGEFLAFTGREESVGPSSPPSAATPPRRASEHYRKSVQEGVAPSVPRSRGTTPRASMSGAFGSTSGTLFVHVVKAEGLKNKEKLGKSDPYVFLRCRNSTAKSKQIENNLNPVFNYDGEVQVTDWETDMLQVSLIDKNVGSDKLMASIDFPVRTIKEGRDETLSGTFKLKPQGTVTITMRFLGH